MAGRYIILFAAFLSQRKAAEKKRPRRLMHRQSIDFLAKIYNSLDNITS